MAQPGGAASRHELAGRNRGSSSTDGAGSGPSRGPGHGHGYGHGHGPSPGPGPGPRPRPGHGHGPSPGSSSGSGSDSSHCTSDCVSARGSPQPPSPPSSLGAADKRMALCLPFEPEPGAGGGTFGGWPVSPAQMTVRERQLVVQNRLLKSQLIRTLEKLQLHMEDSSRVRRLLSRLLKLRSSAQQTPEPAGSSQALGSAVAPADLYSRYEVLVKQNYQLEQALRHSTGQMAATGHRGVDDEYKAMVNMQMSTMQQDWREERDEKERALALNAELHQQVEQLQHQLEQLQRPRSEPFETLEPSGFTGSSSWGPQPSVRPQVRRMLPPPGYPQTAGGYPQTAGGYPQTAGAVWPTHQQLARQVRTRGVGPARSVDEVLSAPYDAIEAGPLPPPPSRRPPVESDLRGTELRRQLPPPGRQVPRGRPAPLLPRDSGYSDAPGAADEGEAAVPLLSRLSVDTGTEEDWTELPSFCDVRCPPLSGEQRADLTAPLSPGAVPPDHTGTQWAAPAPAPAPAPASDEYAVTNTTHEVTCPHCGTVFAVNQHLVYLNHVEECECRRRRRPGPRPCPG